MPINNVYLNSSTPNTVLSPSSSSKECKVGLCAKSALSEVQITQSVIQQRITELPTQSHESTCLSINEFGDHKKLAQLKPGSICFFGDNKTSGKTRSHMLIKIGQKLAGVGQTKICHVGIFSGFDETGVTIAEAHPEGFRKHTYSFEELKNNYTSLEFISSSNQDLQRSHLEYVNEQIDLGNKGESLYTRVHCGTSLFRKKSYGKSAKSKIVSATADLILGQKISNGKKARKMMCSEFIALTRQAAALIHTLEPSDKEAVKAILSDESSFLDEKRETIKSTLEMILNNRKSPSYKLFQEAPGLRIDAGNVMPCSYRECFFKPVRQN